MTPPMTTDTRASSQPAGPDPKTKGKGPMNTTPPAETLPWPADPAATIPSPTKRSTMPRRRIGFTSYTK